MKRLLLTLLCFLFAYPCFAAEPIQLARMNPWVAGSVRATSYILVDSQTATTQNEYIGTEFTGQYAITNPFTANFNGTGNYTLRRITFYLKKFGSPTGTLQAHIWLAAAYAAPQTSLGSSTTTITSNSLTTDFAEYSFDFDTGIELTDNSEYHIVLSTSAIDAGSSDSVAVAATTADVTGWTDTDAVTSFASSTAISSPTWGSSTHHIYFKTYKLE